MAGDTEHIPVLVAETLDLLSPRPGGRFIDCTVNGGGHSAAILGRTSPDGSLLGLDADSSAIARAEHRLAAYETRARLVHANFRAVGAVAREEGFTDVDGILLDLGFSTHQIEGVGRGLSFNRDEPLDMRFDQSSGPSAEEVLATSTSEELASALHELGEERHARRIATAIVEARVREPLRSTAQLAALVSRVVGGRAGRIHPATRTFQALRILVNDELGALAEVLPQAVGLLRDGGRHAVISFHSLEDRIVKRFFLQQAGIERPIGPRHLPPLETAPAPTLRIVTRRPTTPSSDEIAQNPRSRSARLRVAERL